jgi:hypothetical protein
MNLTRRSVATIAAIVTATAGLLAGGGIASANTSNAPNAFIGPLHHTKVISSTVPQNGDVNPYGVAVVRRSTGNLHKGDVLVSNFNDKTNTQGTGTTIVQVNPHGGMSLFAGISDSNCPGGVGLTTALVVLRNGWVIVGSLPTQHGGMLSGAGCLIVLDQWGHVQETITGHGIDGPWDMTALDLGNVSELFVTNVLGGILGPKNPNGGTVVRLIITSAAHQTPQVLLSTRIGSGFPARTDAAALVIGPTGVGLGLNGTLYVADSLSNRIAGIRNATFRLSDAGPGFTVSKGAALNDPLGLAIAPNGHILTANGADGNLVETTPGGRQIAVKTIDRNMGGGGNLFGLAVKPGARAVYFVDDFGMDNNLQLFF